MNFTDFLNEVTYSDFDVSVDFGDGKFTPAGSFNSTAAAKREGRSLCTLDGNGKRYKVTNTATGKSQTFSPTSKELTESGDEFSSRAGAAYKEAFLGVREQMRILEAAILRHHQQYEADQSNKTDYNASWGFAGDLNHVRELLVEINKFIR